MHLCFRTMAAYRLKATHQGFAVSVDAMASFHHGLSQDMIEPCIALKLVFRMGTCVFRLLVSDETRGWCRPISLLTATGALQRRKALESTWIGPKMCF